MEPKSIEFGRLYVYNINSKRSWMDELVLNIYFIQFTIVVLNIKKYGTVPA